MALVIREPSSGVSRRFFALFVPPFADEMNKSRRMVALQARALADAGGVVAMLDPRGTGDSAGDHGEATWDGWCDDSASAWTWLDREGLPGVLWGLRLGALLATDLVVNGRIAPSVLLLWQPVVSGRAFVNQFLRLASTQQMVSAEDTRDGSKTLRAALNDGASVEIAGYDLHPRLVAAVDALELESLHPSTCDVVWRDTSISDPPQATPATSRVLARWRSNGDSVNFEAVSGPSFWASQEIAEAPDLVASTCDALTTRGLLEPLGSGGR